jgi:hypothetical protein
MVLSRQRYLLLLLAPVSLAAGGSDTVNERIPVSRVEMEAHWQVNCSASWGDLRAAMRIFDRGADCVVAAELQRNLQLCAFIHQPPGGTANSTCPDYQGAGRAAGQGDCHAINRLLEDSAQCRP